MIGSSLARSRALVMGIISAFALGWVACGGGQEQPDAGDMGPTDMTVIPDVPRPDMRDTGPPTDLTTADLPPPPNTDPFNAPVIKPGEMVSGAVAERGGVYYWALDAAAGSAYRVTVELTGNAWEPLSFAAGAGMEILRQEGQRLNYHRISVDSSGTSFRRTLFITQTGRYPIGVSVLANLQLIQILYDLTENDLAGDPALTFNLRVEEVEPEITDVTPPEEGLGRQLPPGDVDIYRVTADAAGFLGLRYRWDTSMEDVFLHVPRLEIYSAGNLAAESQFFTTSENVSTLARTMPGEYLAIVDNFILIGNAGPTYALSIEEPAPMTNDTCGGALDVGDPAVGTEVTPGDANRKRIEGWTAANNDNAQMSQAAGMCLVTPEGLTAPVVTGGPDVIYNVTVPGGQRLSARLDAAFDGALYLVTNCEDAQTSCVAGGYGGETVTYVNETKAPQTLSLYVDATSFDLYGGFFSLLTDTNAQCAASSDCAQLGDFCQDFRCVDPSNGGVRVTAAGTPVAIPDSTADCMMKGGAMPGKPATATFAVNGATGTVSAVHLYVDIAHTFIGDVALSLVAPDGNTTVEVRAADLQPGENLVGVIPDEIPASGNLAMFNGLDPNGTWTLRVTDSCMQDAGMLNNAVLLIETSQ